MRFRGGNVGLFSCGLVAAGILAIASPALAVVKREGAWPSTDPKVTLDVSRVPREEAIRKLAEAAGWSVVVHAPQADLVDVHVKDQPAGKVLDLLLLDADYVATRDGTLVSIRRAPRADPPKTEPAAPVAPAPPAAPGDPDDDALPAAPPAPPVPPLPLLPMAPPVPPAPPAPPVPGAAATASPSADLPRDLGRDLDVSGDSLKVRKNEVVHNVTVAGGALDVYGTVTGDVRVMGGAVHVRPGARVFGDVVAFGGDIRVDDDGRIDGSVKVAGGSVRRGDKAIIGGDVKGEVHSHKANKGHGPSGSNGADDSDDEDEDDDAVAAARPAQRLVESKAAEVGATFARMALLFVFGTVLLALQPERMDALKTELVARPMRSFAMGVLGAMGAVAAFFLLIITVVGIPFALLGVLAAGLALAASGCAVLETVGRALVRHRSQNPYVHLGLGCALFLGVSAIPYLGVLVGIVVALLATGILVSTRGAGLLAKTARGSQPYRAVPV